MSESFLCEKGKEPRPRRFMVEPRIGQTDIIPLGRILHLRSDAFFLATHSALTMIKGFIRCRASTCCAGPRLWRHSIRTRRSSPYFAWILEVPAHVGAVQSHHRERNPIRIDRHTEHGSRWSCRNIDHAIQVRYSAFYVYVALTKAQSIIRRFAHQPRHSVALCGLVAYVLILSCCV